AAADRAIALVPPAIVEWRGPVRANDGELREECQAQHRGGQGGVEPQIAGAGMDRVGPSVERRGDELARIERPALHGAGDLGCRGLSRSSADLLPAVGETWVRRN